MGSTMSRISRATCRRKNFSLGLRRLINGVLKHWKEMRLGRPACPTGLPLIETSGITYRIIQRPDLVVILYEETASVPRVIFLDGRPLPKDPNPSWLGYSVGRWDEDTLVVDTIGFNDRTWLDTGGHPHSESLHVTECFRRLNAGSLELRITIDDPKTFAKPFTVTKHPKLRADYDVLEYICNENERDSGHMVGK
jgi:hypothetical protein